MIEPAENTAPPLGVSWNVISAPPPLGVEAAREDG